VTDALFLPLPAGVARGSGPWVGQWRAHEKCGGFGLSCGWTAGEAPWGAGGQEVGEVRLAHGWSSGEVGG